MKRRRLIISLFLIAAVALLGIGYSAVSKTLSATTEVGAVNSSADFNVVFVKSGSKCTNNSSDTTKPQASILSAANQSASLEIKNLASTGDKVEFYLLIQNTSKVSEYLDATLATPYIEVYYVTDEGSTSKATNENKEGNDVFKGPHFLIKAEYVDIENADPKLVDSENNTATLKAPSSDAAGEQVYLKITVTLENPFVNETNKHRIVVDFKATAVGEKTE